MPGMKHWQCMVLCLLRAVFVVVMSVTVGYMCRKTDKFKKQLFFSTG